MTANSGLDVASVIQPGRCLGTSKGLVLQVGGRKVCRVVEDVWKQEVNERT